MKFTERFCEILASSEKKQSELAQYCYVSKQSICEFKKGRAYPSIETLYYICKFFNVSSDYLLGLEAEDGTKMYDESMIKAGEYMSPKAQSSGGQGESSELEKIFSRLTPAQQENLLNYALGMDASNDILNREQLSKKSDIA